MSTLNVEAISHPTSGSNVTINGITPAGTNQLGNRNLIINGAMQVAQRGTSSTASTYGTVDRFRPSYTSGTVTQTQQSLTSGDPYDEGFRHFLRTTNTTAGSDDATEEREIRYYVEAQNLASSGWNYTSSTSYLTLSFWARSSVGGTYYVLNRSVDGTNQSYTFSFTLTANTWTKVTHSIPGNSNITVDNDNGVGFQVRVSTDLGTNFTDSGHTLNTWAAFNNASRCPDFSHDWAGTTDATFDITGVQLEAGSVATPFEHRSYGDELARCLRYYWLQEVRNATNYGHFCLLASYATTADVRGFINFPVPMRQIPALSNSDISHFVHLGGPAITAFYIADGGASYYNTGLGVSLSSAQTGGYASILRAFNTNNAELRWDAEL
jgi:hypothetical protein